MHQRSLSIQLLSIISIGFLLLYASRGAYAMTSNTGTTSSPLVQQTLNSTTVKAFMDAFMSSEMRELHVPGAAVVVVQTNLRPGSKTQDSSVLFAKGYGKADLAKHIPVDVKETLFRAGSVSKLFTATAVMQLAERGKVDLQTDVNVYLGSLQLEPRFDRPVTVADLLLHTAGFDEVFFGMHVRTADELLPLADFLKDHLPERYSPPGEIISYNDHGYTLAGLLVEEVSGMPFDEYVHANILKPLQMNSTTFVQPLPAELEVRMATGYRHNGREYRPYKLDFVQVSPAAGLVGPAQDMANFMLAHLNSGRFGDEAILQPETVAEMHQTQFAHHPTLRGRGYGFSEWRENDQRMVFHDGGNPGFLSRLVLLPEKGIGFYVVFNSDQYSPATRFHRRLTSEFLDTFFPEQAEQPSSVQQVSQVYTNKSTEASLASLQATMEAAHFGGYYRPVQAYSHDTLQKIASLMEQFPVSVAHDHLTVFGQKYMPVEPFVFHDMLNESTIVFRSATSSENRQASESDSAREITHLFVGTGAYVKVPWYEAKPIQIGLVLWFLLVFIGAIVGGFRWQTAPMMKRGSLFTVGLTNAIFLIGLAFALTQLDVWSFAYGPPLVVQCLLVLPLVTLALTLLIVGYIVVGWQNSGWNAGLRFYSSVVVTSLLAFPLFLDYWNLLGFRYP